MAAALSSQPNKESATASAACSVALRTTKLRCNEFIAHVLSGNIYTMVDNGDAREMPFVSEQSLGLKFNNVVNMLSDPCHALHCRYSDTDLYERVEKALLHKIDSHFTKFSPRQDSFSVALISTNSLLSSLIFSTKILHRVSVIEKESSASFLGRFSPKRFVINITFIDAEFCANQASDERLDSHKSAEFQAFKLLIERVKQTLKLQSALHITVQPAVQEDQHFICSVGHLVHDDRSAILATAQVVKNSQLSAVFRIRRVFQLAGYIEEEFPVLQLHDAVRYRTINLNRTKTQKLSIADQFPPEAANAESENATEVDYTKEFQLNSDYTDEGTFFTKGLEYVGASAAIIAGVAISLFAANRWSR